MRLVTLSFVVAAFGFIAAPASARHHQGEKPEVHHKTGSTASAPKLKVKDNRGTHPEPGDDRGAGKHGKDDGPNHK